MEWSEEYPEGISLKYTNREDDYEASNFVITFECNSYVEYEIIDFLASDSLNRLLLQSKYACTNTVESFSSPPSLDTAPSSNISTIGIISSAVLLSICFVLISYVILVIMFKTKGKMEKKNHVALIPPPV